MGEYWSSCENLWGIMLSGGFALSANLTSELVSMTSGSLDINVHDRSTLC